jgi:poly-gamma-glutamate synthesis protein (capsule biosynthesis protein)
MDLTFRVREFACMSPAKSILMLLLVAAAAPFLLVAFTHGAFHGGEDSQTEVRLLFAGDILLSRGVERELIHNPQSFSRALQSTLSGADWAIGNLEGAVGSPDDCAESAGQSPCFAIRDEFIPLLREAGFKAMGLANNHSSDLGQTGIRATRRLLAQNDMQALTYEESPHFIRTAGHTIGLISLSMIPGRGQGAVDVPGIGLRQKLRVARSLSNLVVVYIHWGSEFLDWPERKQRQAADWFINNGADIIVGHHPHLVQKPECLHGKPVFYSLGNLVFDQKYPSTKEGLLADCRISGGTVSCTGLPTRTPAGSILPAIGGADTDAEKVYSGCVFRLSPGLMVSGITLRPENSSKGGNPSGFLLEAVHEGKVLWKTGHAKIVSIEPMKVGGPQPAEYLFTLERHFSPMDGEEGLRPCVYEARPDSLVPKWRGTALAWPLLDAAFLPGAGGILCAEHRGDSFIALEPESKETRIAAYRWKGFGFSGINDTEVIRSCRDFFQQTEL